MTNSIKVTKNNRKAFTSYFKLFGMNFESSLFNAAGNFTQYSKKPYNGGHWTVGYFGETQSFDNSFPIVPNDSGDSFSVCNPENYFEAEMTNRAFGAALFLHCLSQTSFQQNVAGANAAEVYHLFRDHIAFSIASDEEGSMTTEEGKTIFQFLD